LESRLNSAEQQILKNVSEGKLANLVQGSGEKREITAEFVEALLTGEFKKLNIHRHGVNIKNAKILIPPNNKLDLKLALIPFEVKFTNCDFIGPVDFEDSQFDKNLSMEGCSFAKKANFIKMVVKKSAYFRGAVFSEKADFRSVKIGISLNMESAIFCSKAYFNNITIQENGFFGERSSFRGPVDFSGANVGGVLDFGALGEGSTLQGGLDCTNLKVGGNLALRDASVTGPAKFGRAVIKGDLKFEKSKFLDSESFASFQGAKVGHIAYFEEVVFNGPVDFDGFEVGLELKANNARFAYPGTGEISKKGVTAGGLKVGTIAYFEDAEFQGPVNFSGADINGVFNASGAKFHSKDPADFSGMKVGQLAQFTNVEFHGKVLFSGLTVGGKLIANVIANAKEELKGAEFKGVVFGDSEVCFEDAHLSDLKLQGTAANPLRVSKLVLKRLHVDRDLSIEHASVEDFEAGSLQVDGLTSFKDIEITRKIDLRYSKFGILELKWKGWNGPPQKADLIRLKEEPEKENKQEDKKEYKLVLDGMVYEGLLPLDRKNRVNWIKLINHSKLDTGNYKRMESYFRNLGYESAADQVFMAMKRRELEESWAPIRWCTKLLWGWLAGYGRKPHYAFIASLFVILFGAFFYSPMMLKEDIYQGWKGWLEPNTRYKSWIIRLIFSLDQFLPAVNLGLAGELDLKKATFGKLIYFHIHKILGWILILIGLAAITTRLK
jgi:uncharacterized protein YjbI with pentapeptide repeats